MCILYILELCGITLTLNDGLPILPCYVMSMCTLCILELCGTALTLMMVYITLN